MDFLNAVVGLTKGSNYYAEAVAEFERATTCYCV